MGFTISKNQGSGRTVITVTPEEKNTTDKDIIQVLTVEAVDGSTKEVKLIHKKEKMNGNMLSEFHLLNYTLSLQEKVKRLLLYLLNNGNQWKESW